MELPLYQVDAFTNHLFGGNPAAVVLLEEWLEDDAMLKIARENNLSETAFVCRDGGGFHIRWFTPAVEVDLCGHATLASAHVLFKHGLTDNDKIQFASKSGELVVSRDGDLLVLDFPSDPPRELAPEDQTGRAIALALGATPLELHEGRYHLAVFESAAAVASLEPDFAQLADIPHYAVIATAPGEDCDFVSRFFGPRVGVSEDPVTGSAHCILVPYWGRRLEKTHLHARQTSARAGELFCEDLGQRVRIAGHAVEYLVGKIEV
jgi:PhzF family phenazine biosynthesis protein